VFWFSSFRTANRYVHVIFEAGSYLTEQNLKEHNICFDHIETFPWSGLRILKFMGVLNEFGVIGMMLGV